MFCEPHSSISFINVKVHEVSYCQGFLRRKIHGLATVENCRECLILGLETVFGKLY